MYGLPAPAAPPLALALSGDVHGESGVLDLAAAWHREGNIPPYSSEKKTSQHFIRFSRRTLPTHRGRFRRAPKPGAPMLQAELACA